MAENFLGYIPLEPNITDWSSLSGKIGEIAKYAIGTRGREREAFRETRLSNEEQIASYEVGQSQTLNDLVLNGADDIRSMMYEWNKAADKGEMTRAEYNKRQQNVYQYWSSLANSAKTFDQRVQETLKRQQPDENGFIAGSNLELYINKKHSEIANLKNKSVYTNPESGVIYLVEKDENGQIRNQIDVRQMNNPGNTLDNRVDLESAVVAGTEKWGDWTTFTEGARGSSRTISDLRKNPSYIAAKNTLIESILSNPRSITSVLADNSDMNYSFYSSMDEKMAIMAENFVKESRISEEAGLELSKEEFLKDQESKMIFLKRDETGVYQPELTNEQIEAARKVVSDKIEVHIGLEEKGQTKRAPSYFGGGGGSGSGKEDGSDYALYEEIRDAWRLSETDPERSVWLLNNASGGKYRFSWEQGGITVREGNLTDDGTDSPKGYPIISRGVTDLRNLAPYFFGTGTGTKGTRDSYLEFDQQKSAYYNAGKAKRSSSKKSSTPKKGDVMDGYKFLGGDPSDQNNWKKV